MKLFIGIILSSIIVLALYSCGALEKEVSEDKTPNKVVEKEIMYKLNLLDIEELTDITEFNPKEDAEAKFFSIEEMAKEISTRDNVDYNNLIFVGYAYKTFESAERVYGIFLDRTVYLLNDLSIYAIDATNIYTDITTVNRYHIDGYVYNKFDGIKKDESFKVKNYEALSGNILKIKELNILNEKDKIFISDKQQE